MISFAGMRPAVCLSKPGANRTGFRLRPFFRWKMQLQGQIDNPEQPRFVEALVQNNTITELVGSNANLLIHLGQAQIEIPAGFDSATIRVVLETLQGGPC